MELDNIWVFDEAKLEQALATYRDEAVAAYPDREELIDTVMLAMRDFLHSEHAKKLKFDHSNNNTSKS